MVPCRLCGFQGSNDITPKCPVCGEAYDDGQAGDRRQGDEGMPGPRLANAAAGGVSYGKPPQKSPIGGETIEMCTSTEEVPTSTYLNLNLQSLLQLIPEQQHRKKKAEGVVVRAAGGGLSPTRADDGYRCDPDGVYIRPRVDPTMRVLKVGSECFLMPLKTCCTAVSTGGVFRVEAAQQ